MVFTITCVVIAHFLVGWIAAAAYDIAFQSKGKGFGVSVGGFGVAVGLTWPLILPFALVIGVCWAAVQIGKTYRGVWTKVHGELAGKV